MNIYLTALLIVVYLWGVSFSYANLKKFAALHNKRFEITTGWRFKDRLLASLLSLFSWLSWAVAIELIIDEQMELLKQK